MLKELEDLPPKSCLSTVLVNIHSKLNELLHTLFPGVKTYEEEFVMTEKEERKLLDWSVSYRFDFSYRGKNFLSIEILNPYMGTNEKIKGRIYLDYFLKEERNLIIP
jgi:hypothetical protein